MCGIAGFSGIGASERVTWMVRQLTHRGPDDVGVWQSRRYPVAVGNRRLKILDLSPLGHQPMVSDDGRWVLTFNGEIYNYIELRQELESLGRRFRSQTDTEVLLAALQEWGAGALLRLNGMFAFALWDDAAGNLLLARDRLGIKPLYYASTGDQFSFASEITAVLASGLIEPQMDTEALGSYLRLLWVPEPHTLFANVKKLEPGCLLNWDGTRINVKRFWDLPAQGGESDDSDAVLAERLFHILQGAAARQLRSDVPVGAFLSGGLDSTTILALAVAANTKPVRTYSIGFRREDRAEEGALSDARYAKLASHTFGVVHEEIVLEPDVVDLMPRMVRHLEDPVADPAAINCYLISRAARETSTVLLSGTGGDELFGGIESIPPVLSRGDISKFRQCSGTCSLSQPSVVSRLALDDWDCATSGSRRNFSVTREIPYLIGSWDTQLTMTRTS